MLYEYYSASSSANFSILDKYQQVLYEYLLWVFLWDWEHNDKHQQVLYEYWHIYDAVSYCFLININRCCTNTSLPSLYCWLRYTININRCCTNTLRWNLPYHNHIQININRCCINKLKYQWNKISILPHSEKTEKEYNKSFLSS